MKKTALGFIALAMSILATSAKAAERTGDIRSIDPCDQYGYVIPNGTIDTPYSAGQTVYFRIRLENLNAKQLWENRDGDLVNPWQFKHISGLYSQEAALAWVQTPPKVGVWVSGSLKYANVHWYGVPEGKKWYTDLVCSYTVQPGDLAFPMALADSSGNKVGAGSASEYKLLNVGGANPWRLVANMYDGASSGAWLEPPAGSDVVCSFRWAGTGTGDNCLNKTFGSEVEQEKGSWKADLSLEQAGLYIKTVDFAASEYVVAEGRTDRLTVNIEGGANTNGNGIVYAKIKKGDVVSLAESSMEEIDMWDGTATNTYQVAKVMIPSGEDVTSFSFKVKGDIQSNKVAVVYLSSTKEFAYDDTYAITTNFVVATVRCVEPPPPYIQITLDGEASKSVTSSPNYRDYASKLTVTLSEPYTSDITVEVTPSMVSGAGDPLGKYIAMSSYSENGYTVTNKTVTFTVGDMENGVLSKDLYVYVLGADNNTDGVGKGIKFTPAATGAAGDYFKHENISAVLYLKKCTPKIEYPVEDYSFSGLAGGVESAFTIKISDDYSNMQEPFTVDWLKLGSGSGQTYTVTPNSDGEAIVNVRYNAGEYTTRFRVQNAAGVWSDYRTIKVQVNPAKQVSAVVVDPPDADEFDESLREISIRFRLTEAYEDSRLYAYLVPQNPASSNLVSCKAFKTGVSIRSGDTESSGSPLRMTLLDGSEETQPLLYSIVLTTASVWGDGDIIGTYESKDLEIFVNNVAPKVLAVNMSGSAPLSDNGGTFGGKASMGLNKIFTLEVDDVDADLTNDVTSVWTFSDPKGTAREITVTAPLDKTVLTNVFAMAGTYSCTVKLRDKDMGVREFGETFKFNVEVLKTPSIEIAFPNSETFDETEADKGTSYFEVKLSTTASEPLAVALECVRVGTDGVLNLVTNELTFAVGADTQRVLIDELDGTANSVSFKGGFSVKAKVLGVRKPDGSVDAAAKNEDGVLWSDMYIPAETKMYVANEAPTIVLPIDPGATNDAAINVSIPIAWKVDDVDADLGDNLTVTWTTSEGAFQQFTGSEVHTGVFTNIFKTGGAKSVTMTVTDKDNGMSSITLYYRVAPSKAVKVHPYGPYRSGPLTQISKLYADADGLGEGRVWSDGTALVTDFEHKYTFGFTDTTANLYAWGYRNGDKDNGSLSSRDIAISKGGNSFSAGQDTSDSYVYSDRKGRDSFFYAWVIAAKEEESTVFTGTPLVAPLAPSAGNTFAMYTLALPTEQVGNDANPVFADRFVEAFFAKELYVSDNMGDMNADGIPDYYATKSWSMATGESKSIAEALTGQAISGSGAESEDSAGAATASDLARVDMYNDDGDFLPAAWGSSNPLKPEICNWGPGFAFTARKEIRGFGEGLNELGVSDYDLTAAESNALFAAASVAAPAPVADYAAATNWAAGAGWTPEAVNGNSYARLNPLTPDTDGDGFDDGWEYYFWYYAKIGAVTNGVWGRLEGRRYSPMAPATGVRIAPEEIAAAFDPHVARATEAAFGVDFDADGLSDLEEFVLGTNPCDWDSDGDGASDFWEVMNGLNPCSAIDGAENPDCDFMARSEYQEDTFTLYTFADGKVFGLPTATASSIVLSEPATTSNYYKVELESGEAYWFETAPVTYAIDSVQYLAKDEKAFATLDVDGTALLGEPVVLASGTKIASVAADAVEMFPAILPETGFAWTKPTTQERGTTAQALELFNYGGDGATYVPCTSNVTTYADIPAGVAVVKVQPEMKVTLIHDQVMVQYGFDPRVAWNINEYGFLDDRWRQINGDDAGTMGFAGVPTNTVPYASRDEYLLAQYRMNAQRDAYPELTGGVAAGLGAYGAHTTYPNLPIEFIRGKEYAHNPFVSTNSAYSAYWDSISKSIKVHGADSDNDGVPDGWELYVNSNPNLALVADNYMDDDELSLVQEYAGVDSCNAYTNRFDMSGEVVYPEVESITKNNPGKTVGWWNKFFPTNPRNNDTDGDGLRDHEERNSWSGTFPVGRNGYRGVSFSFIYGDNAEKYAADGTTLCFRGGGLNPCTVDTDCDLLPDAWEYEFAGVVFKDGATSAGLDAADLAKLVQADGRQAALDLTASGSSIRGGMDGTFKADADYDFDQDGLANFQEYLVQTLRHIRYDDALTPLMGMTPGGQFIRFLPFSAWDGNAFYAKCKESGFQGLGAWQFRELGYFSLPPHSWDPIAQNTAGLNGCQNYAHSEGAGYRILLRPTIQVPMVGPVQASGYACTDPRRWDTDNDGMDDYYEIFHGLNPILGSAADPMARNEQGLFNYEYYDVIASIYGGTLINAWNNNWTDTNGKTQPAFDAIRHPWLMGTMECDADGDGLRNDEEALKVDLAKPQSTHTDPTPLWMTDSSSVAFASFTSQYYGPDPYIEEVPNFIENVTYPDLFCYPWTDINWRTVVNGPGSGGINRDWMFSFEENEGYDTDHDFKRDATELVKGVEATSDPLDFMDPNRRQALYLPGVESAAVSYDSESRRSIGTEPDLLKQFTVECWVRPEGAQRNVVIMERVCVYGASTLSNSQSYVRANFRIGVDASGRVYGEFEGTSADSGRVTVTGRELAADAWTHVAFTYNGYTAALYLNGEIAPVASMNGVGIIPANGIDGILQESGTSVMPYTGYRSLPCANIIGASALTPDAVSVNPETTWSDFSGFYKGWIDEVRVWDGARTPSDIHANYLKRFSFDDVAAQRETVYKAWRNGATRADSDPKTALPTELLLHYNFATLPGGVEPKNVITSPTGFQSAVLDNVRKPDGKALDEYLNAGWWSQLDAINSKVYFNRAIVPWIPNTVSHLPLMDGSSVDSRYWSSYAAGLIGNQSGYEYPNSANPYSSYVYRFEKLHHLNRLAVAGTLQVTDGNGYPMYDRYMFQLRSDFVGTTDLLPLGGAFAKRGSDFWDGQGAMDAWTATSYNYEVADADGDGIPDWAWNLGYKTTEAYLRALAEGLLPSKNAEVKNDAFANVADSNNDGLYDWWQQMHDLKGTAKSDTDRDGLADFAEYLVSDVFGFGDISPVLAKTNGKEFDYFRKAGKLYLGELFTDHDFMEDDWENLFANSVVDAAQYDPSSDPDGDGWSNYAECRAGTLPDRTATVTADGQQVPDYPEPLISVKAFYKNAAQISAPIVVKAYSGATGAEDAKWNIPGSDDAMDYERIVGVNPGVKTKYLLGPSVVVPGTVEVYFRDSSELFVTDGRGVWGSPSSSQWRVVLEETPVQGNNDVANLSAVNENVGTLVYRTGEMEIDYSSMPSYRYEMTESSASNKELAGTYTFYPPQTNTYVRSNLAQSYVKIKWQSKRLVDESKWQFALSRATTGHVREGLNTFIAFVDLDGDGEWSASEPMGIARNVNVGWNSADVEIDIADDGMRFDLGFESNENSATRETKVKLLRYKVNEKTDNAYGKIANPLILDFNIGNRSMLHEGDFMKGNELDIDWNTFGKDVLSSKMVVDSKMNVTSVTYVVQIESNNSIASNRFEITRYFTSAQVVAEPCNEHIVNYSSRPVFKWTIPEGADTFTAFSIQVKDKSDKVVWSSGFNKMPPRSISGAYEWLAPLYVNDLASAGKVFVNGDNYTWQVSLHNARYQAAAWSKAQTFRMNVYGESEANPGNYGIIKASVKYFGPGAFDADKSKLSGKIRVEAWTNPGFTGVPAARGFVADAASVTNGSHDVNVTLVGLEAGTYYLRAFIDSDGDGKRSDWESWGYVCPRGDIVSGGIFNPVAITVGAGAAPVEVCYIEDTDVDQDCLPDVYEYDAAPAQNKTAGTFLAVKGVAENANNGYISVNPRLQTAIDNLIGAGNTVGLLSLGGGQVPMQVAALSLGVPSLENTIEESTLAIKSISLENGAVNLTVGAEANEPSLGTVFVSNGKVSTTIVISYANSLNGEWSEKVVEKTFEIEDGSVGETFTISLEELGLDASKGFFKVGIR